VAAGEARYSARRRFWQCHRQDRCSASAVVVFVFVIRRGAKAKNAGVATAALPLLVPLVHPVAIRRRVALSAILPGHASQPLYNSSQRAAYRSVSVSQHAVVVRYVMPKEICRLSGWRRRRMLPVATTLRLFTSRRHEACCPPMPTITTPATARQFCLMSTSVASLSSNIPEREAVPMPPCA